MYKLWNYPNNQIIGKSVSQTCKIVLSELHSRNHLGFWLQTIYHFRHYTISIIRYWPRKIFKLMPFDHVYCRINDFQTCLWELYFKGKKMFDLIKLLVLSYYVGRKNYKFRGLREVSSSCYYLPCVPRWQNQNKGRSINLSALTPGYLEKPNMDPYYYDAHVEFLCIFLKSSCTSCF